MSIEQARAVVESGDVEVLQQLLAEDPKLVKKTTPDNPRTLLHTLCDFPAHRLRRVETAQILIDAGADVNARVVFKDKPGPGETPLHWSASSDDVELIDALVDGGADVDIDGGIIANGTPLWEAVVFCMQGAAHKLIERGATYNLMIAAGVGRLDLVETFFNPAGQVTPEAGVLPGWTKPREAQFCIDSAFGMACRNGYLETAQWLLYKKPDINAKNPVGETPLDQALGRKHPEVANWLMTLGARRG